MARTKKEEAPGIGASSHKVGRPHGRRFLMLEQRACRIFAQGRVKLTQTEFRVWMALMAHSEYTNNVKHNQAYLAEFSGLAQQHFSTGMKGLIEHDMVATTKPRGKQLAYMLSPEFIWMGPEDDRGKGMAIYTRLRKAMKDDTRGGSGHREPTLARGNRTALIKGREMESVGAGCDQE